MDAKAFLYVFREPSHVANLNDCGHKTEDFIYSFNACTTPFGLHTCRHISRFVPEVPHASLPPQSVRLQTQESDPPSWQTPGDGI